MWCVCSKNLHMKIREFFQCSSNLVVYKHNCLQNVYFLFFNTFYISFENDGKLLCIDIYGGKMIHFILRLWNHKISSKENGHYFSICIPFLTVYFLLKFSSNSRILKLTFKWPKLLSTKRWQYVPFASLYVHGLVYYVYIFWHITKYFKASKWASVSSLSLCHCEIINMKDEEEQFLYFLFPLRFLKTFLLMLRRQVT